ncbi:MAG: RNA methyltransferase [Niabella sp.]
MLNKSEAKYIQSLSQKKFRLKEGLYVIEGPKIVGEALVCAGATIKKIYALKDWADHNLPLTGNRPVEVVLNSDLERISQLKTPNEVLALVQLRGSENFVFQKDRPALALDGIRDPGNLGTIIRIADWFGIKQVICSEDCADIYNSKVVQATMGSIFRVQTFYTCLSSWLARQQGVKIYGAALDGNPLKQYHKINSGIIVIGNESKGIREDVMPVINEKITIERLGSAESLNAAVATGIILSHVLSV